MVGTNALILVDALPRPLYQDGTWRRPFTSGNVAPLPRLRKFMLIRPSAPSPWKVAARVCEPEFQGIDAITSAASAAPISSMSAEVTTESGDGESAALRFR